MMRNICIKKALVVGIIVLFLSVAVTPTIGISNNDDTTPPVTTISFDPPEPDGKNGWYISDVTVWLNATDDMSGVNVTYYRIDGGVWEIYDTPFVISKDGDDILIEFYSIDKVGNVEDVKSSTIDIDQTEPEIDVLYDVMGGNPQQGWDILFRATATDDYSGMERVEFYIHNILQDTVYGPGPIYEWGYCYKPQNYVLVSGLIRNLEVTEDYVNFYAMIVIITGRWQPTLGFHACAYDIAGNIAKWELCPIFPESIEPGIYLFQSLTLPNNYEGYIGRFIIHAYFLII